MHFNAYINLSTYFLCLSCGRSLDFFLVPKCLQAKGLKRHPRRVCTRMTGRVSGYIRFLYALICRLLVLFGFRHSNQVKRRSTTLSPECTFKSCLPGEILERKGCHNRSFLEALKSSSWLIRKKPQCGRDLHTSREYRFKYYPVVSLGIEAKKWSTSPNDQKWIIGHGKYRSMRTQLFPSPLKQFFKTLSLRRFAYEFAQHKEVPGDQLKPSKERIKNVNISNQQRRC